MTLDTQDPIRKQYNVWATMIESYNNGLDMNALTTWEQVVESASGRYTRRSIANVPLGRYLTVGPVQTHMESGEFVGITLRSNWAGQLISIWNFADSTKALQIHSWSRATLKLVAQHSCLGFWNDRRGDHLTLRPLEARSRWDGFTHNTDVRRPYFTRQHLIPGHSWHPLPQAVFRPVPDSNGFWRVEVLGNSRQDVFDWNIPTRLQDSYDKNDRLYRLRRARKYRQLGRPDPEIRIIAQQPVLDALAKAFPIITPAQAIFPERKPREAALHG